MAKGKTAKQLIMTEEIKLKREVEAVEHNRALLEADWSELERPLFWGLSRKSFLEATITEKKMKDRDEALDW